METKFMEFRVLFSIYCFCNDQPLLSVFNIYLVYWTEPPMRSIALILCQQIPKRLLWKRVVWKCEMEMNMFIFVHACVYMCMRFNSLLVYIRLCVILWLRFHDTLTIITCEPFPSVCVYAFDIVHVLSVYSSLLESICIYSVSTLFSVTLW